MQLEWSEEFATGIEALDSQHRMLFKAAADYAMALQEGRGEATFEVFLMFLAAYMRAHFRYEERCMEEFACPAACANRKAHAEFAAFVDTVNNRYTRQGYSRELASELAHSVESWLRDHIGKVDSQLKACVLRGKRTKQGASGARTVESGTAQEAAPSPDRAAQGQGNASGVGSSPGSG